MSEQTYAQARAALWAAIAQGVADGLNPPRGLQDHETDGVFHALLYVERPEDVMAWTRHLGDPVSPDYRREPLAEPEVRDHPEVGRRYVEARALIAADREVNVTYAGDMPDGSPS